YLDLRSTGLRLVSLVTRHLPCCTLFPYTTLFRSRSSWPSVAATRTSCVTCGWRWPRRDSKHPPPPTWSCAGTARPSPTPTVNSRSEEHTSELQSRFDLVCRLLLEKKKNSSTHSSL